MPRLPQLEIAFLTLGSISLLCYFIDTFISTLVLLFSGIAFLLILVWIITYKRKVGLWFTLLLCFIVGIHKFIHSEFYKSPIVLSAILDDDRSYLELRLRKNNTFEMISNYMFGEDIYEGEYKLSGNKIIFLQKPYDNDFIPDTVYIIQDKIVLRFYENGEPVTGFSADFDIKINKLK